MYGLDYWPVEQEVRGSISRSRCYDFRDWLSPASNVAIWLKSLKRRKCVKQPTDKRMEGSGVVLSLLIHPIRSNLFEFKLLCACHTKYM